MEKSVKSLVDGERVTGMYQKDGSSRKGEEYTRQDRALGPLQMGLTSGLYEEFRTVLELFWRFLVGVGGGGDGGEGGGGVYMSDHVNEVSQPFDDGEPFPGIFNW